MGGVQNNGTSVFPMVTRGGRFVVFESTATNLVAGDVNDGFDVFLRDTCIGAAAACTPTTILASVANDGSQGNGPSERGVATDDGRYVFFVSGSSNLVANDTNAKTDLFVRDTCIGAAAGCVPSTKRVVKACGGGDADDHIAFGYWPTPDGRFVALSTGAQNLLAKDDNGAVTDVFVVTTGL
jgi:hypothetical protein